MEYLGEFVYARLDLPDLLLSFLYQVLLVSELVRRELLLEYLRLALFW
jgi:hypothetical protein